MTRSGTVVKSIAIAATVLIVLIGSAIALGGPKPIAPMASIGDPYSRVDYSWMPPLKHYQAADGASLAYRLCEPAGAGAPPTSRASGGPAH